MVENKDQSENPQEKFVRVNWRLTGWGQIPCSIYEGLFPNEFALVIKIGEDTLQLWADKSWVEQEDKNIGWVNVRVVKEEADRLLINLPNETLTSGSRQFIPKPMLRGIKVPSDWVQDV